MGSTITRAQIRSLVIGIVREDLGGQVPVREISRLGEDLGISPERREGYVKPIRAGLAELGCELMRAYTSEFRSAYRVGDIVDLIWSDIQEQTVKAA